MINRCVIGCQIEQKIDVVKCADHIIDLGPEGRDGGGRIVTQGTPEEVAKSKRSITARFLRACLRGSRRHVDSLDPDACDGLSPLFLRSGGYGIIRFPEFRLVFILREG